MCKRALACVLFVFLFLGLLPVVCAPQAEAATVASQGLEYSEITDEAGVVVAYAVSGIGTCTDIHVVIPSSHNGLPVTRIADKAFYNVSSFSQITIPDTVTSIGIDAFCLSFGLSAVHIPASVTEIASSAFSFNSMTEITVAEDNPAFCAVDGVLFSRDMTILYRYCQGKEGETYVVPDTVTTIADYAFVSNSYLTEISLPDGLTTIGQRALSFCYSLERADIPSTVTEISGWAFADCPSLQQVTIPAALNYLDVGVFGGCSSLTEISVEAGNTQFKSVDGVLYSADGKKLYAYPASKLGDTYTIEEGTEEIGAWAFSGTLYLTQVFIPNSMTQIHGIAFSDCASLIRMEIPDSVTKLGSSAFSNCTNLEQITLPASVTSIGSYSFDGCSKLTQIIYYGTEEAWNAIVKGECWNRNAGAFTLNYVDPCAQGHSWDEGVITTEPGCLSYGVRTFTCTVCGKTMEDATVAPVDHQQVTDAAVAATCTSAGLTEGQHCTRCNEILVPQTEIPATGHSFGQWTVVRESTCTIGGEEIRHCEICNEAETRTMNVNGVHNFGQWSVTKEATRKYEGEETRLCAYCSAAETQAIPALGGVDPLLIVGIVVVVLVGAVCALVIVKKKK